MKPGAKLLGYPKDCLKLFGLQSTWASLLAVSRLMLPNFPENYKAEMQSAVKAAGVDEEAVLAGNTMFDIKKMFNCSTLYLGPERTQSGQPMVGRNLDFPTLGYLQDFTLVTVYHPEGKRAFASVGFPGAMGCLSGMNESGLTLAVLEVYESKDDSLSFDFRGTPYALCFRRMLEECDTIDEAVKLLRSMKRTTLLNLMIADRTGGAVLEITPNSVEVRRAEQGWCAATNHFRAATLCVRDSCRRYAKLSDVSQQKQLTLADLSKKMHEVNQGRLTLQTMVFEPVSLKLHLAFGSCPSSALPLKTLDLKPLLSPAKLVEAKKTAVQ